MSTDSTAARLAEIRARLAAATPGPWSERDAGETGVQGPDGRAVCSFGYQSRYNDVAGYEPEQADLALMVNAPTDLAWLCDHVERLRGNRTTVNCLRCGVVLDLGPIGSVTFEDVERAAHEHEDACDLAAKAELEARVDEMRIAEMHLVGGRADFTLTNAAWYVARIGAAIAEHFDEAGATNYVEQTMYHEPSRRRFALTVQLVGAKTPHDARLEAEAERDEARAEADEAKAGRALAVEALDVIAGMHCDCYETEYGLAANGHLRGCPKPIAREALRRLREGEEPSDGN